MTHIETARVNETLGLQIGIIRDWANRLSADDIELLEEELEEADVDLERA